MHFVTCQLYFNNADKKKEMNPYGRFQRQKIDVIKKTNTHTQKTPDRTKGRTRLIYNHSCMF